jgi:hypothetical protein
VAGKVRHWALTVRSVEAHSHQSTHARSSPPPHYSWCK